MSPKELSYIEDALSHEEFLRTQCRNARETLQDESLKSYVETLEKQHEKLFETIYSLV